MRTVELRSDTFTKPDAAMLDTMMSTEVGDDVFGEDPTVNRLEQFGAALFGKEAGLFCPSGTMCNQIAMKVLSVSPGEMICESLAHVYLYEGGGAAFNAGLSCQLLSTDNGILSAKEISAAINPDDVHKAKTCLVSIENTHNRGGGSCYELDGMKEIKVIAEKNGLKVHIDGARIYNAITAKAYTTADVGACCDTISVCLSKGLGAPVGSVLLGSSEVIYNARRIRKVFGGGMRQAGYLAAAGLYALENNVERLSDDHARASAIGEVLRNLSWVSEVQAVETNIVVFRLEVEEDVNRILSNLNAKGVRAVPFGPGRIRMVFHKDVSEDDLTYAIDVIKNI